MADLQETIQGVLNNPELMQQIMAAAGSLAGSGGQPEQTGSGEPASPLPDLDLSRLSELTGLLGKAEIDADQKQLLSALEPFLSSPRIRKLHRAMRAAKLAELAGGLLGSDRGGADRV